MLNYITGNIFDSQCQALVNPVNCVGIMSKGLALQFKQRFPEMYWDYRIECEKGNVRIGEMHVWKWGSDRYIINFPTKKHWRNPSQLEWIILGLQNLAECARVLNIDSIAIPKLGCKNGGLNFDDVKKEIEKIHEEHWQDLKAEIYLF